ncbi:unnamed protein product [Calypogeia fissa]
MVRPIYENGEYLEQCILMQALVAQIGINAPQGCGKTTVVESLEFLFKSIGRSAVAISVDDFYLTGAD